MFKKTLTAIIAATTLFGFNANSFAFSSYVEPGFTSVYAGIAAEADRRIFVTGITAKLKENDEFIILED